MGLFTTPGRVRDEVIDAIRLSDERHTSQHNDMLSKIYSRMDEIVGVSNGKTPDPNSLLGMGARLSKVELTLSFIKGSALLGLPAIAIVVTILVAVFR